MEYKVNKPNKYTDSVIFTNDTGCNLFVRNDDWYVSGEITQAKAQELLDAHNPSKPSTVTIEQKLASVGLSIDDLKAALGL
jgi:hypothetical protein